MLDSVELDFSDTIDFFSVDQVANVFKDLRTRKATGPDGISALLLKSCVEELAPSWYPLFQIQ